MEKVAILGVGTYGMALAHLIGNKGYDVTVWSHDQDIADYINKNHQNNRYLQDIPLPGKVYATCSLEKTISQCQFLLVAIPTHFIRSILIQIADKIDPQTIIINAAKGIENQTLLTISEIFLELLPTDLHNRLAYLSGPSFAIELAQKQPTAMSVASQSPLIAETVQKLFSTDYLRLYTSDDVMGIELCGALKNIIAIAAGIVDGLNLGHNSRAALITRGLAEITRLGVKKQANPLTFLGLAGIGDLVLTCTGDLSRNRFVGKELAKGRKIADIVSEMTMIAEGVKTSKSAYDLSKKLNVEMPISEQVYRILYEDLPPKKAVVELMTRDLKSERL